MKYYPSTIIAIFMGIATLSGCERSAAEKIAIEHSEIQARINTANYERNKQMREMKEEADQDTKNEAQ